MKNKKIILIVFVLLLGIGFAATSYTFYARSYGRYKANTGDFAVKIVSATLTDYREGVTSNNDSVVISGNNITFTASSIKIRNDYSTLSFTVKNDSTMYDANMSLSCNMGSLAGYITFSGNTNLGKVTAQGVVSSNAKFTLNQQIIENMSGSVTCTITATAAGRTSIIERS